MLVMPLTTCRDAGFATIEVPGACGEKVFRIRIGMSLAIAGAMVCGWITLAPK